MFPCSSIFYTTAETACDADLYRIVWMFSVFVPVSSAMLGNSTRLKKAVDPLKKEDVFQKFDLPVLKGDMNFIWWRKQENFLFL